MSRLYQVLKDVNKQPKLRTAEYIMILEDNEEEYKSEIKRLKSENAELRKYVIALETCKHAASYCDCCPSFQQDFDDEGPHCAFDFEGLRAAAGIEVSNDD